MTRKLIASVIAFIMTLSFSVLIMMAHGLYHPENPSAMVLLIIIIIFSGSLVLLDIVN